jgi:type I restriction enzyme S subunit
MTEWQNLKLSEIVSIKTGKIDANKAVENGKFPFFTCAREISRINDAPYEGKVVLVAGNGDLNVKYYEGKFNAYQRTYFLTSLDESIALPKYIYFFMEHYLQILRTQSIGTTVKYIKMENLSDAMIPLPAINEQHKIVELLEDHLSHLDAALVDVKQAKTKIAQFRRSLLRAAFTGNLGSRGTGSLAEIPSDWNWVTLDEAMSECKNGLTYRNNPELAGFPVSRIETISKGEIDFQKVGYGGVSLEGNQKHLLAPGDILFSHINSMLHVGKVAIYKRGMPALLHGMNLLRITPSDDFVPEFLFFLFQSSDVRKQIWSKAKHAVNQASINIGELKTVVVPKPPIKEQQRIVEILEDHLSRLEASVSLAEVMERQSNGLRRSLLQAAFTGQLTKEVESV